MRCTSITIILLLLFSQSIAQDKVDLEKYWNYRDNLTSKFLIIGTEPGMSLPAAYRNEVNREIKWADNMITLGWYIGVLATEYHLLNNDKYTGYELNNKLRVSQNKYELYCALLALRRLDESAETSFRTSLGKSNQTVNRNGFMIRDDVPENFHEKFPNITNSQSDFSADNDFNKEMSQDQIYHILMGLALVKRFIPKEVEYEGVNFVKEAQKQAELISWYLSKYKWRIKNPLKFSEKRKLKSVDRGHQAYIFSGGIKKAVKYINDGDVNLVKKISPFYAWYWNTLRRCWNPTYTKQHNVHMIMSAASAGNGWNKRTSKTLIKLSHKHEWYAYPLIHESIFNSKYRGRWIKKKKAVDTYALRDIKSAPAEGIRSPYPNRFEHKWSTNMKYIRDLKTQYTGRIHSQNRTYNGLDFMLLFNSYYITRYP
ncbi:MAG: hypothetical protein HKN22_07680 [Bacteroidia bacterium]|nr:hypothetical protein [Bacteroidia bacterium]